MKDDEEALQAAVMGIRIQSCWAGAIPFFNSTQSPNRRYIDLTTPPPPDKKPPMITRDSWYISTSLGFLGDSIFNSTPSKIPATLAATPGCAKWPWSIASCTNGSTNSWLWRLTILYATWIKLIDTTRRFFCVAWWVLWADCFLFPDYGIQV